MTAEWRNTTVLVGDAAETVAEVKATADGEIIVQGSSELIGGLQRAEPVDEYRLLVFPVVLGKGRRLFSERAIPAGLRLTGSTVTSTGVNYVTYDWAGKPLSGSVA
ncbi:dihydrofolate reductase family protein [Spongiactinospora sp. TRM90649]|uniref:dihydrofolate reductase family protein n=1 Tax=Spongiactinospora sp. TRM90649 TaxID=3031114 RepID=UPI0023F7E401|nr:dihydrofolate reductase family protein [Spongiactinospora sp. TRM90649]MDF5752847.1 dihydrofolate reductase family protein [Spongiactinospora sp. TRM90649]